MNNYDKVLELIREDSNRSYIDKPFSIGENAYATNGYVLVEIPKDKLDGEYAELDPKVLNPTKVLENIPPKQESGLIFTLSSLDTLFNELCPKVDDYDEFGKDVECRCCDGNGSVMWTFDYLGREYERYDNCPICEGDGLEDKVIRKPNGKKKPDLSKQIKIGNCYFLMSAFSKLYDIAKLLDSGLYLVAQGEDMSPNLFEVGGIRMIAMPCYMNNEDDVFMGFDLNNSTIK